MSDQATNPLLLTNWSIFVLRCLLVLFLGLISVAVGIMMLMLQSPGNSPVAYGLFVIPIFLLWFPLRVPISVLLRDGISVRYPLQNRQYANEDISEVEFGEIRLSANADILSRMYRQWYVTVTFALKNGKRVTVLYDRSKISFLKTQLRIRKVAWSP